MIAAHNISVRLDVVRAINGVSFTLARGETLGIIGPPASGKTTLLKALAGLVDLSGGEIYADQKRVDAGPERSRWRWRQRIGMAFQNNALFDGLSVFENVAFPLRMRRVNEDDIQRRVYARLTDVGLREAGDKLPEELSGGMRKRAGIARATIAEPEIGLFDDPIAGLDPLSASKILELVLHLGRSLGMTTAIVSNDLAVLLPICTRVLMLNEGRVAYDGPPDALASSERPDVVQFVTGSDDGPL